MAQHTARASAAGLWYVAQLVPCPSSYQHSRFHQLYLWSPRPPNRRISHHRLGRHRRGVPPRIRPAPPARTHQPFRLGTLRSSPTLSRYLLPGVTIILRRRLPRHPRALCLPIPRRTTTSSEERPCIRSTEILRRLEMERHAAEQHASLSLSTVKCVIWASTALSPPPFALSGSINESGAPRRVPRIGCVTDHPKKAISLRLSAHAMPLFDTAFHSTQVFSFRLVL